GFRDSESAPFEQVRPSARVARLPRDEWSSPRLLLFAHEVLALHGAAQWPRAVRECERNPSKPVRRFRPARQAPYVIFRSHQADTSQTDHVRPGRKAGRRARAVLLPMQALVRFRWLGEILNHAAVVRR